MKLLLFICGIVMCSISAWSQSKIILSDISPDNEYENIYAKKIYTDKHTSTFIVWIKKEVKAHKHVTHTEQVHVLEGKARVQLNDKEITIQKGDWITIPENTIHAVTVLSKTPLKLVSIQTPEFKGKDRVFIQ